MLKNIDFVMVIGISFVATAILSLILKEPKFQEIPNCVINMKQFQCASKVATIRDQVSCLKKQETAINILRQCVAEQEAFLKRFLY